MTVTTATTKLLEPALQLAQHYRLDQTEILENASLTHEEFSIPGARFPTSAYGQILQMLAHATDNPRIALNLGEATQPRMLGSIGFLMSTAATLGKAYQALIDYLPLLFEGAIIQMEQTPEGTLLTFELNEPELQPVEYLLACLINWPRWLTGHQIPVRMVQLEFSKPENLLPYQQFFAAEVQFEAPRNQVLLASDYLSLSCIDANPEMHQLHREFADSLLSKSAQQSALTAQTRNLIRRQLAEGNGCIRREQIAESVGLSLRTLQRKLGHLGTNFQDIYDQTRRDVCLQLIQRGQLSFGEITFQLGFSNQSAFQKAFKRWMGVAPSQYRQQIKPVAFIDASSVSRHPDSHSSWLQESSSRVRISEIEKRIGKLNSFTLELLEWAALLGEQFSLAELGEITNNPVARLAIHLWPAEQLGLIDIGHSAVISANHNAAESISDRVKEESVGKQTLCYFCHAEIRSTIYQRLSETEKCALHRHCGMAMLKRLPSAFTLDQITPVLWHLNRAFEHTDTRQNKQLRQLNIRAAGLAQREQRFGSASRYLSNAYRLLKPNQITKRNKLLLQRARLHLLAGEVDPADQCLQQLPTGNIAPLDSIDAALITAEICLHRNQHALALSHLLENLALLTDSALPETDNQQLLLLLEQHAQISALMDEQQIPQLAPLTSDEALLRLQLLEKISQIARQQSKPLLAACAIGQMTRLSLQQGRSHLTPFAFVSYAWVASWFCADFQLAQIFSVQGMQLANQFGGLLQRDQDAEYSQKESEQQRNIATNAALLQCSLVQHWFTPIHTATEQLRHIAALSEKHGHWLVQSECHLLQHQLSVLTTTSLNEQLDSCRQHYHQMLDQQQPYAAARLQDSSLRLMEQLCAQQDLPDKIEYQHGWQAVSTIIAAFLLNQQHLWPQLYSWEIPLENELAGYFCVSEALFCTAMMRLILAQQQQLLVHRRRLEVDQIESRFELWAKHCPENFKTQHLLLQAEKARLLNQPPEPLYEQAIESAEQHGFSHHRALCYERYGDFLQAQQQSCLARFCLQKSRDLYSQWGASSKARQIDSILS
ncbi:AraC family transcriptional regulator ligand-binding domain-containing protein [uncultured Amphritea sp.]|uniref:AraC family transcriptional regulator ligand-binding domain-containing protein n=1 Tax=uncultured Amphritea sp. TaxID=981605 RepID=UPI0025ED0225|nr:AraC family transcriptional regulator ligand-binding domain-containing protein [uncultured Amphritea sp.]